MSPLQYSASFLNVAKSGGAGSSLNASSLPSCSFSTLSSDLSCRCAVSNSWSDIMPCLLPGVKTPLLLQLTDLFFEAFNLSIYVGFLRFPGLLLVAHGQLKRLEAGYALDKGIPDHRAESTPRYVHISTGRAGFHGVGAGAGTSMFLPQVILTSAYPTGDA